MHGCSKTRAAVCWACCDVAQVFVVLELNRRFNRAGTSNQSLEHSEKTGALLHGNDAELVFFVNPDQESLLLVVEDTTTVGPVTVETASLEETITLPKKMKRLI